MFIDASAIVAILNKEQGWQEIAKRFQDVQGQCYISPLVRFEASLAVAKAVAGAAARAAGDRRRANVKPTADMLAAARDLVNEFVTEIAAREVAVADEIGNKAIEAAMTYGKAVGHPADLNFGDCFAYACAKAYRIGLIYKGDDFAQTDLA